MCQKMFSELWDAPVNQIMIPSGACILVKGGRQYPVDKLNEKYSALEGDTCFWKKGEKKKGKVDMKRDWEDQGGRPMGCNFK